MPRTDLRPTLAGTIVPLAVGTLWLVCVGPAARAQTVASGASASGVRVEVVDGKPRYTNRLIASKSPYLQLHAHNPVDWFPWGDEAFDKARREGKALFVSIGYSTCHWCHVMEQESFSDPAMAEIMNRYFVSIKVDREERPDIDRLYITFLELSVHGAGYPATVFLTPDLKPFFGGTYFPKVAGNGLPSFHEVLTEMSKAWNDDRDNVAKAATGVADALRDYVQQQASGTEKLTAKTIDEAYA